MSAISLTDFELTRFFFALVVLLAGAHGVGYFFQRLFKMPKVIGEIVAGLLLGPTVFGFFFPAGYQWLFNAFTGEGQLIAVIYWIGLVLLMFISGFEVQKAINREDRKLITAILIGATAVPFLVGWLIPSVYDFTPYLGEKSNMLSLTIIIAIAISITSIPVISKIFIDLKIMQTRFAKIVLATATIEDVILWVALAVATGLASSSVFSISAIVWKVIITFAFFAASLSLLPKMFEVASRSRYNLILKSSATGYVLFTCFLFAAVASILSVNIIFGAFLAGIVIGLTSNERVAAVKKHVSEIGLGFFIPVSFAVVGLKLNLIQHFDIFFFIGFFIFAVVVKMLGTILAARLMRENWLSSFNLGMAMNARGGPGIVLATVAFDAGIISETFFSTLIMLAILTSLMAGYWFRYVLSRKWELLKGQS